MRVFRPVALFLMLLPALQSLAGTVTLEQLRADQAALDAARRDYQQRADGLQRAEREDYRGYVERLRQRLAADCSLLRQTDVAVPPDIACPEAMYRVAPAAIDQGSEQTRTEAAATLDAELDAGLGEFDQRLLREQERIKAKAPKSAGGSGASSAAQADITTGSGGSGSATETTAGSDTATSGTPVERPPGTTSGSASQPGAGAPPPPDIPEGSDDDVVARQLREAAAKETDPELRKKLWEEYRRYKQGVR